MTTPECFATMCNYNCANELVGLLLSLSVHHRDNTIFIISDTLTKQYIETITPTPKLNIIWHLELDKYHGFNRIQMERNGTWSDFQMSKAKIISYALEKFNDVMLLDTDIIVTNVIDGIDKSKSLGVSPHYIDEKEWKVVGYYNGGVLWTNNKQVPTDWIEFTKNSRYYDQASIEDLVKKYDFFEFDKNYNMQCWRFRMSSNESEDNIDKDFTVQNNEVFYQGKVLKFVHTHFTNHHVYLPFNKVIINKLDQARKFKELAIIFRVYNKKWLLRMPKQPMSGRGNHKNDSYRELPEMMKQYNSDLDVEYQSESIQCWISPNIVTYDRPTLEWFTPEMINSSLILLGNGDVNVEGKEINNMNADVKIKPWIFWPRTPLVLEKTLSEKGILNYNDRTIESIFIGNFESNIQEKYRKKTYNWEPVLSEYHLTAGRNYLFTHEEYLLKLRQSKFGLCIRGYGSKCHREVELMAFGTVPVITPEVSIESYMDPLIENVHYIKASNPSEFKSKIESITQEQWMSMSQSGYNWYQRNVHSKNCWKNTIEYILYKF